MSIDLRNRAKSVALYLSQRNRAAFATRQQVQRIITLAYSRLLQRLIGRPDFFTYRHLPPKPFPTEIWIQIVEACWDPFLESWMPLTKTCWFFIQISQACLYKEVTLWKFHNSAIVPSAHHPSLFLFERSLEKRPELGAFVHKLTLATGSFRMHQKPRQMQYSLLGKLALFPNLERLKIIYTHVDIDLWYTLYSHRRLRVVDLSLCTVDDSLTSSRVQDFPDTPISDVIIRFPKDNSSVPGELWAAITPVGLQSLTLFSMYPPRLSQGIRWDWILSSIMMSGKSSMLKNLSINFVPSSMIQFLVSSPQLRNLDILPGAHDDADYHVFPSLPADAIPLLEHYRGPWQFLETLLRNRPVHRVTLDFESSTMVPDEVYVGIFVSLGVSSGPVTELILSRIPFGAWLLHIPITVRYLEFRELKKRDFIKWLPALSALVNLDTVYADLHTEEEEQDLGLNEILQISDACPSLREFDMYRTRWIMVKPNVWEHFQRFGRS